MFISINAEFILFLILACGVFCFVFNLFWFCSMLDARMPTNEEVKRLNKESQEFAAKVARVLGFVALWLLVWLQLSYSWSTVEYKALKVQTGTYSDGSEYDYVFHNGLIENLNEELRRDFKEGEEVYEVWRPSSFGIHWSKELSINKPKGTEIK